MKTMRALVWTGPGRLEFQSRPVPEPAPGELLIQTRSVGICGTDLHIFEGRFAPARPPLVPGHEAAGIVEEIGDGVEDFWPGDPVLVNPSLYCGQCEFCRQGHPNQCLERQTLGLTGRDGAWAEFFVVPARNAYALPESISWEQAAAIDPLACATHALDLVPAGFAETVAVFGAGPSGLCFLQLCGLRDASRIIVVDSSDERLKVAARLSATDLLEAGSATVRAIRKLTGSLGVHVAIEASGAPEAVRDCIAATRNKGNILIYGVYAGLVDGVDFQDQHRREITIYGSSGATPQSYQAAIQLVGSSQIDVKIFISHRIRLEDVPRFFCDGIIQQKKQNYLKAVVLMD